MPEVRRTPIVLIILASYLMLVLDISIVITALPRMRETLGFSTAGLSWVENAYTLAFGGLLLSALAPATCSAAAASSSPASRSSPSPRSPAAWRRQPQVSFSRAPSKESVRRSPHLRRWRC
jgi:hypothetical protein